MGRVHHVCHQLLCRLRRHQRPRVDLREGYCRDQDTVPAMLGVRRPSSRLLIRDRCTVLNRWHTLRWLSSSEHSFAASSCHSMKFIAEQEVCPLLHLAALGWPSEADFALLVQKRRSRSRGQVQPSELAQRHAKRSCSSWH